MRKNNKQLYVCDLVFDLEDYYIDSEDLIKIIEDQGFIKVECIDEDNNRIVLNAIATEEIVERFEEEQENFVDRYDVIDNVIVSKRKRKTLPYCPHLKTYFNKATWIPYMDACEEENEIYLDACDKEKQRMQEITKNIIPVDLGLPSGTKWASCNIGATKPEEFGSFYAWGETKEKDIYNDVNYSYSTGDGTNEDWCERDDNACQNLGKSICGTRYDVAHVKWGDDWKMPSSEQIRELLYHCKYEWTELNDVPGCKFTGPNGKSIFMPAAGYLYDSNHYFPKNSGYYWLGEQGPGEEYGYYPTCLRFNSDHTQWDFWIGDRGGGFSVRPVAK